MRFIFLIMGIFFSSLTYAYYPPMPDKCPSVSSIQNTNFDRVYKQADSENLWTLKQLNQHYDTEDSWSLFLENIEGQNEAEAINNAKAVLMTFRIHGGPEEMDNDLRWECIYSSKIGLVSAITPSLPS